MQNHESSFLFPLLITKCPHCLEVTKFGMTEKVAYIAKFLGIGIGRLEEYLIMCGGCGYKEFVRKKDYPKWQKLGKAFNELTKGAITQEGFAAFVAGLDLPELKAILESAATWTCSCAETNPPNFAACWKCGAPSPTEPIESKERPLETGEWHPWKP